MEGVHECGAKESITYEGRNKKKILTNRFF